MTVLRQPRFITATIVFLALETILIFFFGSSFYGDPGPGEIDHDGLSSTLCVLLSFGGYFLLGAVSRSWWTAPIAFLPLFISVGAGFPDNIPYEAGEPLPLFGIWMFAMVGFLPVWAIGVGASKLASRLRRTTPDPA